MADPSPNVAFDQIRRERDLYRRLLALGEQTELRPLLAEALRLAVEITGARLGYLELLDDRERGPQAQWSMTHGTTQDAIDGSAVSQGIVAEALAKEQTIMTPSALEDTRFQARESVRIRRIEAVLCCPIGSDPPVGVLYLQGRSGAGPFSEQDRLLAELFARQLAPIAHRLLVRDRGTPDPTQPARTQLRLDKVIGRSDAFGVLLRQVALIAPLDVSVLLTGPSGTGKSQIARVIHDNGPRGRHPFIDVNCAALPETLIESELFGALPGAHSTATRKIEGKVAAAEGGTLFLDEVGELSPSAQAKLLQLLQSKEYFPLGGTRALHADVRIIAATNLDLRQAVAEKRFRQDLLYRLQVLPMHVPPLAQRRSDIGPLTTFFCAEACRRHGLPALEPSTAALRAAEAAEWPGNVRQLAHAVEAGAIRAAGEGAKRLERHHLFADPAGLAGAEALTFQEATRRFQAGFLRDALVAADWNVMDVAQRLDLARSHVYNLIKAFGLTR